MNRSHLRDWIIAATLVGSALFVMLTPVAKVKPGERINLSAYIPATFGNWGSTQYDMSDYKDKWQSINELIMREYANKMTKEKVLLMVEYSSDLRKNFTFHFPENCYRAAGHEVSYLPPLSIKLSDGKIISVKSLYIRGAKDGYNQGDKIISYWLVIDNKQYSRTFFIKLDQMMAGILNRAKKGFLVRVDSPEGIRYRDEVIGQINKTTSNFVVDLYTALDEQKRVMLFGK